MEALFIKKSPFPQKNNIVFSLIKTQRQNTFRISLTIDHDVHVAKICSCIQENFKKNETLLYFLFAKNRIFPLSFKIEGKKK